MSNRTLQQIGRHTTGLVTIAPGIQGVWHHIAATRQGGAGKLYLDGVLVEGKTLDAPDDTQASLLLGQDHAGRHWPGSLDQVRLYDRALTAHEVLAHVLNADQRYGLWAFEGDTQDNSGNLNHGTDLGAVTFEPGIKGQAVVFNGTTDTIDLGNAPALSQSLSSFSVTAWVRLDKDLGTEIKNHVILGNKETTQGGFYMYLQDHTNPTQAGRLRVTCYNDGSSDTLASTGHHYLADHDWHHVALTVEGGIGKLYVDGLQVNISPITPPGDSAYPLYLGSLLGSSNHWPGAMDEVAFYRRGLQAEEIQSDYLTWAPDSHKQSVTDQGLTAQWDFDDTYQNAIDPNNPAVAYGTVNFTEAKQNQGLQLVQDATVDLGTGADVTLDNGTITLWVKMDTDQLGTTNSRYVLLANRDADEGFRLAIDDDTDPAQAGSIQFTCYTDTTVNALTSGTTKWPDDQNWHHLAVTKKGTHAKMYLDGVLISTTDSLVTPDYESGPLPLRIGATGEGTAYPWKGAIDQLKIFTEPLSPYDILGTYLEGDPVFTEDASRGGVEETRFILFASDTDPFGLQLRESYHPNHENPEPHGFTGQEKEPDLGLIYYGARWYMADLGRFLQGDPERQFWNSYSYGGNDPVNGTDPTGEKYFWRKLGFALSNGFVWLSDEDVEIKRGEESAADYSGQIDYSHTVTGETPETRLRRSEFESYERLYLEGINEALLRLEDNPESRFGEFQLKGFTKSLVSLYQDGPPELLEGSVPSPRQLFQGAHRTFRTIGNLSGKKWSEVVKILRSKGFKFKGPTKGGYLKFYGQGPKRIRIEIQVRPNGQVVKYQRLPSGRTVRFDAKGKPTTNHNAGEIIVRLP